jgi:hypothetical protein
MWVTKQGPGSRSARESRRDARMAGGGTKTMGGRELSFPSTFLPPSLHLPSTFPPPSFHLPSTFLRSCLPPSFRLLELSLISRLDTADARRIGRPAFVLPCLRHRGCAPPSASYYRPRATDGAPAPATRLNPFSTEHFPPASQPLRSPAVAPPTPRDEGAKGQWLRRLLWNLFPMALVPSFPIIRAWKSGFGNQGPMMATPPFSLATQSRTIDNNSVPPFCQQTNRLSFFYFFSTDTRSTV